MYGYDIKSLYTGAEARRIMNVMNVSYPIKNGEVISWDLMESVWEYCFSDELCVEPSEHKVMITEVPLNPRLNREKMTELMFETFNV